MRGSPRIPKRPASSMREGLLPEGGGGGGGAGGGAGDDLDEAAAAPGYSGYSSSPRASSLRASPKGPRPTASPLRGGEGGGGGGLSGPLLAAAAAQDVHYGDPYALEPASVANGHARLKEEHDDMEELEVVRREDKAGGSGAAAESGAAGAAAGLVGGVGMEFIEKIHLPAGAERTVRRANRCLDCGPRLWARVPGLGGAKGTYANVTLLALCWALSYSTITSTLTTTAVAARALIADQGWVTLAVGAVFIGSAVVVVPVALSMHLFGRRIGFMIGCAMGMLGAGLSTAAMYKQNFALLVVGSLLLGGALGHAQFYRFAAADVSTLHFRSKAISLVLAGGIIAAVVGPQLSKSTRNWIPEHEFAGTYISMIILFAANLLPLFFIDFSTPEEVEPAELEEWFKKAATITTDGVVVKLRLKHYRSDEQTGPPRSLIAILLQPECLVSILLASLAYGAMLFIMTPLPLAMIERSFSFNQAALVIQLHMLAMFIPALFTGHLMSTFGTFAVTLTGNVLFVVAIIFMITGQHYFNYMVGMLFLGVAWNFMFIGATNRFTTTYRFSETSKAQALNDTLVSGAAAVASVFSGSARDDLGWRGVQWLALIFLVFGIVLSVGLQLVHSMNRRKKGLTDRRWSGERSIPA